MKDADFPSLSESVMLNTADFPSLSESINQYAGDIKEISVMLNQDGRVMLVVAGIADFGMDLRAARSLAIQLLAAAQSIEERGVPSLS